MCGTRHAQCPCIPYLLRAAPLLARLRRRALPGSPGERREADGYDETVLEGEKGDSLDAAGFEHPYGRGSVPPARVVALGPDALAQVPPCMKP